MAGLVPAIHVWFPAKKVVDGCDKHGHDEPWKGAPAACTQLMRQRLIQDARLEEAVKRLFEGLHPRAIILFGSRARGTNRADSDYDLLVVNERLLDYDEVYRPVVGRGLRCDVVPCTVDAWCQARLDAGGVLRDALDEGIVLYGQS